jgi:hypothetical protein
MRKGGSNNIVETYLLIGLLDQNFPEKTSVFPAPLGLVPAQIKKKKKMGQFSAQREALR